MALPLSLSAAALRRPKAPLHALGGASMGTSWRVKYASDAPADGARLHGVIEGALQQVIAQMSAWDRSSCLSRLHRDDVGVWHAMPPEMATVIKTGLRIADESGGAYDITLGRLVDLWGFGPPGPRAAPPDADAVNAAHRAAGWRRIEISADGTQLRRLSDLHLDLSGIAKGFAVDHVAAALRAQGIAHCLVEIGGELRGHGVKPDGAPWWVEIDAAGRAQTPMLIGLHELAIATSGSERSFSAGGSIYSHTIDPRSGWPIDNGIVSATVLHASCMEADAYATALMVMGPSAAIAFADAHRLAACLTCRTASGGMAELMSSAFQAMLD